MRVLLVKRDECFLVQFLEHSIATQVHSLADVPVALLRALQAEEVVASKMGREPYTLHPPAAPRFWEMFNVAQGYVQFGDFEVRLFDEAAVS